MALAQPFGAAAFAGGGGAAAGGGGAACRRSDAVAAGRAEFSEFEYN